MTKGRIVVGIDGSAQARNALKWAAKEADLRGSLLTVVHSWDTPWTYWDAPVPMVTVDIDEVQKKLIAKEILATCDEYKDLEIKTVIVNDIAARALLEESEGADLIVVGSRGRGGFSGLLLGSVSQQVVHHAKCPVVVVPSEERNSDPS